MSDKKITYINLKEKREDGKMDPLAVERNMLMEAKRDGDEVFSKALDCHIKLKEFFNEIEKDFDKNGIIDPNIKEPKYTETSYVFTKPPKKESLFKRVFSWMKRKITNT